MVTEGGTAELVQLQEVTRSVMQELSDVKGAWQKVPVPWRCLYSLACCIKAARPLVEMCQETMNTFSIAPACTIAGGKRRRGDHGVQKHDTEEEARSDIISELYDQCQLSLRLVDLALLASPPDDLGTAQRQQLHTLATGLHDLLFFFPRVYTAGRDDDEAGARGEVIMQGREQWHKLLRVSAKCTNEAEVCQSGKRKDMQEGGGGKEAGAEMTDLTGVVAFAGMNDLCRNVADMNKSRRAYEIHKNEPFHILDGGDVICLQRWAQMDCNQLFSRMFLVVMGVS